MASQVQWQCADHASVTRYEVGWVRAGESVPVIVAPLPRPDVLPTPVALPPAPGFGTWAVVVQAYGSDGAGGEVGSGWSVPSAPVIQLPAMPTDVVLIVR